MKKGLLIFVLPLVISIGACKKNSNKMLVSGRAIDATNSTPIKNAHLVLGNYTASGTGYSVDVIEETYSDANGNYQFEFNTTSGSEYHIAGKAEKYFETDQYENVLPDKADVRDFDISFTPISHLKLNFVKQDTGFTRFKIAFTGNYNLNYDLYVGDANPDSVSVVLESKGNQENAIEYMLYKYLNTVLIDSHLEKRSYYSVANDTSMYTIKY